MAWCKVHGIKLSGNAVSRHVKLLAPARLSAGDVLRVKVTQLVLMMDYDNMFTCKVGV